MECSAPRRIVRTMARQTCSCLFWHPALTTAAGGRHAGHTLANLNFLFASGLFRLLFLQSRENFSFTYLILFHRALILSFSSSSSAFLEPRSRNCFELGFLYLSRLRTHWVADLYFTSATRCSSQFRLDSPSGKCHPSIHPSLVWIGLPIRVLAGRSSDSNLSTVAARAELR